MNLDGNEHSGEDPLVGRQLLELVVHEQQHWQPLEQRWQPLEQGLLHLPWPKPTSTLD